MEVPIIVAVITLTGVFTTALVTWAIAQRHIAAQHITAERAKWRKEIRALALLARDAILGGEAPTVERLESELRTLLNPLDDHDCKLLACMVSDGNEEERKCRAKEFIKRVSLLLKHDWDRAKLEAGFFGRRWFLKAERKGLSTDNVDRSGESSRRRNTYEIRRVPRLVVILFLVIVLAAVAAVVAGGVDRGKVSPSGDHWKFGP